MLLNDKFWSFPLTTAISSENNNSIVSRRYVVIAYAIGYEQIMRKSAPKFGTSSNMIGTIGSAG